MMNMQKAVAEYIEEKGIRQNHVAKKCGFSKQKMSAIANQKQNLNLEDYSKICVALGVPFDFFYQRAKADGETENGNRN